MQQSQVNKPDFVRHIICPKGAATFFLCNKIDATQFIWKKTGEQESDLPETV